MPLPNRGGWFPSPASEASGGEGSGVGLRGGALNRIIPGPPPGSVQAKSDVSDLDQS